MALTRMPIQISEVSFLLLDIVDSTLNQGFLSPRDHDANNLFVL